MIAAVVFGLRTAGRFGVRRPSAWLLALLWLLVMWSSNPPGLDPGEIALGSWFSLGLGTPARFAVELTVFHLIGMADLYLAARAAGIPLYARLLAGPGKWVGSVVAVAFAGAVLHVLGWCVVTAVKCWSRTGSIGWSFGADGSRTLAGDPSGVRSTVVVLLAAVVTLMVVSLVVAALVHSVASSVTVIGVVGLWCVVEIPLTTTELGLQLARFADPAVVASPDALLFYAERPGPFVAGLGVLGVWSAVSLIIVGRSSRFRAISSPR